MQAAVQAVTTVSVAAMAAWALRRWRRTAAADSVQAASAVGVVGLGVMGSQLTLNLAEKLGPSGARVSGFDLDEAKAKATREAAVKEGQNADAFTSLTPFVSSLSRPRRLLLLVPAGKAVEAAIEALLPLLDKGDVIVDMGNEWFQATEARQARIAPTGVLYVGCGLSGGGEGARRGPCLMPGGPREAWELLRPLLESVAARIHVKAGLAATGGAEGFACVRYIGPGGSGHYVKMVHNGIEYGDMQLIAEAASFCRDLGGLSAQAVAALFTKLNDGPLAGFLMETTAAVFLKQDVKGQALVDAVLDSCGSKGTGKWTIQQAAELGVPCATHAAALEARYLSSLKSQRKEAAAKFTKAKAVNGGKLPAGWEQDLEDALLASKLCSYAQGMAHLRAVSDAHGWELKLAELAAIWQGGCIIRAKVLSLVEAAFTKDPALSNLLLDDAVAAELAKRVAGWRRFVLLAMSHGLPVPALCASLTYFDSFSSSLLRSAQCIQAQRDCFGGHGFQRLDGPGTFSTQWRA